jgi:GNAT superfamily N-acetyltransferase
MPFILDMFSEAKNKYMIFREALIADIAQMQIVRNAVKENILSDPALVPDKDYVLFMTERGKGWVCVVENTVIGFAIADLQDDNIWALFILPEYEHKGIGQTLQKIMLNWYFAQGKEKVWLGTAFNTRAEAFYKKSGWTVVGMHGTKETKFEMTKTDWEQIDE